MEKRTSVPARVLAAATLAVAFVVAIAVVGGVLGGGSDHHGHRHANRQTATKEKHVPATYVVQTGDTLVAIAHRTGVPLVRIEALNPQVDPQILLAGEKLKLR